MPPSCCTIIFVIYGINTKYKYHTELLIFLVCCLLAASYIQNLYDSAQTCGNQMFIMLQLFKNI